MPPEELAAIVEKIVKECRERVEGVGAQQYYTPGKPQKFEVMPLDDLMVYAKEELLDQIVYCVMAYIRFDRLEQAVKQQTT